MHHLKHANRCTCADMKLLLVATLRCRAHLTPLYAICKRCDRTLQTWKQCTSPVESAEHLVFLIWFLHLHNQPLAILNLAVMCRRQIRLHTTPFLSIRLDEWEPIYMQMLTSKIASGHLIAGIHSPPTTCQTLLLVRSRFSKNTEIKFERLKVIR